MKVWLTCLGLASLAILVGIGLLGLRILPSAADSSANGRRLRMYVTGYTSCDASIRAVKACDGITASGRKAALGTVACGSSYPLGTVFEIVGVGRMTCWDRGGGIKDHMLDVWFPDVQSAIRAGISAKWMDVIVYTSAPANPSTQPAASAQNDARAGYASLAASQPPAPTAAALAPTAPAPAVAATPPSKAAVATSQTASAPSAAKSKAPANQNPPPAPSAATPAQVARAPVEAPAAEVVKVEVAEVVAETQPVARLERAAPHVTTAESPLGDLVADMLRTQYGARVGLVANRDLQGKLPAGVVTAEQVAAALTPGRHPLTQDLRGDTLRAALELSLSGAEGWEGFLHVSGLRVGYNPAAPAGQRLTRFEFATGEAVADQGWYRVALTDGVYFGPGYTPILQEGKGLFAYQPLEDMAVHWLRQRGSVQPGLDGRLAVAR